MKIDKKTPVAIKGYSSIECPTSYITPESAWILELADSNGLATRDTGATLFGPDTRTWPAWWMDALGAIATARAAYERAEQAAMSSK